MKEIIEIPFGNYEYCQKLVKDKQGNFFDRAVAGGIKLDGMRNGELLQLLFPDIEVGEEVITDVRVLFPWAASWENVDKDWWFSKWGDKE